MRVITCQTFEEDLASEMALGTLSGDERAAAVDHVSSCSRCRLVLDELSQVSDALLLMAPEVEPPIGFESRVLAEVRPTRRPRRRLVVALTVVVALLGGMGATLAAAVGGGAPEVASPTTDRSPAVAEPPGRSEAKSAFLLTSDHHRIGEVVAYPGQPTWVYMSLDDPQVSGSVVCEITTTSGQTLRVGTFRVAGGRGMWEAPVSVRADQMRSASVLTTTGATLASGSL
jgi:hypothetical protein